MKTTWDERKVIAEALTQYIDNAEDEETRSPRDNDRVLAAAAVLERITAEFCALADIPAPDTHGRSKAFSANHLRWSEKRRP